MKQTAPLNSVTWPLALLAVAVFFASIPPDHGQAAGLKQAPSERTMAITFDDLPYTRSAASIEEIRDANRQILRVLRDNSIPAVGFVNEAKLDIREENAVRDGILDSWLAAGQQLGNHTFSHVSLQTTPLEDFQTDVLKGEQVTRRLMAARGLAPRYFRHPYTQTGPTPEVKQAFEEFLADHGYEVAPFTVENSDYIFSRLYHDALHTGRSAEAARILEVYVEHSLAMVEFFERMSGDLFERAIPQILLIHTNRINTDAFDDIVAGLQARDYSFVSLSHALEDPAYGSLDSYAGRQGLSWLHRWEVSRGLPLRVDREPDPPGFILDAWSRAR